MDFKRVISEEFVEGANTTISGEKKMYNGVSSFDWKLNARQQLGLVLSRHFPSLKTSFDSKLGYDMLKC